MRIRRKSTYTTLIVVLLALAQWFIQSQKTIPSTPVTPTTTPTMAATYTHNAVVTRIIDGDTIEINSGQIVRYIGIDTPETKDPKRPKQCFGQEASQKNIELVEGKQVRLEKDVSETDRYGRLLRYVYVTDETASPAATIFVNEYLVKEGFAYAATFPPDVKYNEYFQEIQNEAMKMKKGLWGICP